MKLVLILIVILLLFVFYMVESFDDNIRYRDGYWWKCPRDCNNGNICIKKEYVFDDAKIIGYKIKQSIPKVIPTNPIYQYNLTNEELRVNDPLNYYR